MSLLNELKRYYSTGNTLRRLILINIGVFIFVHLVALVLFLFNITAGQFNPVVRWFSLPAYPGDLLLRPWTIITYMFLHEGLFHIVFNLLWLFWFGRIFLTSFRQKQLVSVYLLGGFAGGFLFILAYNVFPVFDQYKMGSLALGASAAVMAIVVAISAYKPNYTINLLLIGPVKIKYIAIVVVILDVVSIRMGNAGGHIAHLGGALFGFWFAEKAKAGKNITKGFNRFLDKVFTFLGGGKSHLHVSHKKSTFKWRNTREMDDFEYNRREADDQERMDEILDKISRKGYASLTKEEKEFLFKQRDKF